MRRKSETGSLPPTLDAELVARLVRQALKEDVGTGDATTNSLVPERALVEAAIITRASVVVSGNPVAESVFKALDASAVYSAKAPDGTRARANTTIATIRGRARAILTGERTALNFMQRLTGIATLTSRFVEKAAGHGVAILDTRKTTPLLRALEKYAVLCGGGQNHRIGLYDRVLIKDNHWRLLEGGGGKNIVEAVAKARRHHPGMLIEVEIETEEELESALAARPDWILLDNMKSAELKRSVALCSGKCLLEASGGITLKNIEAVARTGVNAISLGCLTHSAPAADLSLEIL